MISEVWKAGIVRGQLTRSRHPGESRDPGQHAPSKRLWIPAFAGMTEFVVGSENATARASQAALDTGFGWLAPVSLSEENDNLL